MEALPQIAVEAFIDEKGGTRVPLGLVDFTADFAERISRFPPELDRMLGRPRSGARSGIFVSDIANALPMEARPAAWEGRVALPGLKEALETVAAQIGGDFAALHAACVAVRDATLKSDEAERELEKLSAARWETDTSRFEMFYGSQFPEDFVYGLDDVTGNWRVDEFTKRDPRPKGWEGPELEAWSGRHNAWVRANIRPYAYATCVKAWEGITLERIREAAEDDGGPDVESMIESDMDDHHEDALERVVDSDALHDAVSTWLAQGGLQGGDDAALGAALEAWNARQTIISYEPDLTIAVPIFPDVTQDEAMAFAVRRLAAEREALDAARGKWRTGVPAEEANDHWVEIRGAVEDGPLPA